jgi:hypothetical protein
VAKRLKGRRADDKRIIEFDTSIHSCDTEILRRIAPDVTPLLSVQPPIVGIERRAILTVFAPESRGSRRRHGGK